MHQDYILRLIEQLVATLHAALGLRREDDPATALRLIDGAIRDSFGWGSALANSLPMDTLLGMLSRGEQLDVERAVALAVLLRAEGDCYDQLGQGADAYRRYTRSLALLLAAHDTERNNPMLIRFDEIPTLLEWLAPYELPDELLLPLARYHERVNRFDRAEDMLWIAHRSHPEPERLRRFYQRLLALPDALLDAGGLPRAEILEAMAML